MPSNYVFIDRDKVVMMLIKYRCKLADCKSKDNQKREFLNPDSLSKRKKAKRNELYDMFPSRKHWCNIGEKNRNALDTSVRNERRLKLTYLKAKKNNSQEDWYLLLCKKADAVVKVAISNEGMIPAPRVSVIEKKCKPQQKKIIYRPVCSFPLTLKIIFSLLNKYLTRLFDNYFYDCSYAFRMPSKDKHLLQHLNAVEAVRDYRCRHLNKSLYVAECDMQKFYDTISHRVIKTRFALMLQWAKRQGKINNKDIERIGYWFWAYIDCFNFIENVFGYNRKPPTDPFWGKEKCPDHFTRVIEWVDKKYLNYKLARKRKGYVGVPQGGALSGLIANIVMHFVDNCVLREIQKRDILYCRFCDDMILIGENKDEVKTIFDCYYKTIRKSHLIPHLNKDIKINKMKEFWEGKTRGPYEWGEKGHDVYPWITFVGFDFNWKGNLRIRRPSFQKHIAKQTKIANELLLPYERGGIKPRYCAATILNSLKSRLIATSVGHVSLRNFRDNPNIRSWMSAFSILDKNHWSSQQLRELDKHRMVVIARTKKRLSKIECSSLSKLASYDNDPDSFFIYMGCPYSYYGQCFNYKK